eukprot:1506798-Amphidinium_carterae.1
MAAEDEKVGDQRDCSLVTVEQTNEVIGTWGLVSNGDALTEKGRRASDSSGGWGAPRAVNVLRLPTETGRFDDVWQFANTCRSQVPAYTSLITPAITQGVPVSRTNKTLGLLLSSHMRSRCRS